MEKLEKLVQGFKKLDKRLNGETFLYAVTTAAIASYLFLVSYISGNNVY